MVFTLDPSELSFLRGLSQRHKNLQTCLRKQLLEANEKDVLMQTDDPECGFQVEGY